MADLPQTPRSAEFGAAFTRLRRDCHEALEKHEREGSRGSPRMWVDPRRVLDVFDDLDHERAARDQAENGYDDDAAAGIIERALKHDAVEGFRGVSVFSFDPAEPGACCIGCGSDAPIDELRSGRDHDDDCWVLAAVEYLDARREEQAAT